MEWYKIKDKKPIEGVKVLVQTHLFRGVETGSYRIDARGIPWWDMDSRACPNVHEDDQWAYFDLPEDRKE